MLTQCYLGELYKRGSLPVPAQLLPRPEAIPGRRRSPAGRERAGTSPDRKTDGRERTDTSPGREADGRVRTGPEGADR